MKTSNKSNFITGIILIVMAALFSISLFLQLLDFGMGGPGYNNILYNLGNMLVTVYGISSILVPIFLLVCGISSFVSKWTSQKTMYLITAILPFFTCVFTEKICRMILGKNEDGANFIKISIVLVTGLMLVIIEILGAGLVAERVNQKIFYRNKRGNSSSAKTTFIDSQVDEEEMYDEDYTEVYEDEIYEKQLSDLDEDETLDQDEQEEESEKIRFTPIKKKNIFGKALSKLKIEKDNSFEDLKNDADELFKEEIPSIEDYENIDDKKIEEVIGENQEESLEEYEDKNPASIITQEEYAALIKPDTFEEENSSLDFDKIEAEEELEWPNLPLEQKELPPDYVEDFEENSEEDFVEEDVSLEAESGESTEPLIDLTYKSSSSEKNEENMSAFELGNIFNGEYNEELAEKFNKKEKDDDENNAYYAAKFIDSVVHSNSSYPTGISLHDESTKKEEEKPVRKNLSPYSSKISLKEESDLTPEFSEIEDFAENEEDLTEENLDLDKEIQSYEDNFEIDDDFDDLEEEKVKALDTVYNQISEQEKDYSLGKAASDVFADMDADIRKEMGNPGNEKNNFYDDLEEDADSEKELLDVNKDKATNLTADELTDFFNAQQKENTPVTNTIEANINKTNRASKKGPYVIPSDLLTEYENDQYWIIDNKTKEASLNLKKTLAEFNIEADVIGIKKGPVVTMFEILPAPGVRLSKIVALQDNIALSLAASSVRIVAPIPGKQAVGIEVPNKNRSIVSFREIIEQNLTEFNKMAIPVILGKDILGKSQLIDLAKTPHMLIAGATGSGKSVCVNSIILSILYKRSFRDVKLILVDPKVVELKLYNNIPHLLTPVVTEPKKAIQVLQYCLCEMERRYALLDGLGVRDIASYNARIKERKICTEKLPYIVVIIDEFADLMATSGRELETTVARLTAMSRAVGIHLVLATQRPSVNVITGLIKANIPSRVAFMVASRTDSNIIIDSVGAEKLLGRGDMLYTSATDPYPVRIQGTYISDQEVEDVVEYVKQYGEPEYIDDEIFIPEEEDSGENLDLFGNSMDEDPLYDQALEIVVQAGKASASYIQRRLKIGYNRAARLVEEMEERGIVGPANGSKPREVIYVP